MAMDQLYTDALKELEAVKAEREEYRKHLSAIAEMTGNGDDIGTAHEGVNAVIEERDALAAHVELLSDNLQASINGIEWYRHNTSVDWGEADDEHLKYCEEAIKKKPATSLARRDALKQSEVLMLAAPNMVDILDRNKLKALSELIKATAEGHQ